MKAIWNRAVAWFSTRRISQDTLLMVLAVGVGSASALGVVGFYKLIDLAFTVFFRIPADHVSRGVFAAYRPFITSIGLVSAWVVFKRIGRGRDGMNVPDVQLAVARRGGYLPVRGALARTAASAITLGSGGSAGSEGPVAVLGSTIGSWVARVFRLDSGDVNVLVAAGGAAGIAAAFNAPLAGAFFALEEILGVFSAGAFAPVVISSVVGAVISRAFFGNHPAFPIPQEYGYSFSSEIFVLHPLLGVLCGLVAVLFIRTYFKVRDFSTRFDAHPLLLAAGAGALVGILVFLSRGVLVGYGHLAVRLEVFGRMAWYTLALLAIGKVVATSLTVNLGGSGGVFTPSLYIGAATGGAFGVAVRELLPGLNIHPEAYALVGMGALVAAATDAPITGILIVFEMTNDYAIMPALMLVVAIAVVVARRLEPDSLYSGYLRRRGQVIRKHVAPDALSTLRIPLVMEPPLSLRASQALDEVLTFFAHNGNIDVPVIDDAEIVIGTIRVADLEHVGKRDANAAIVAADIAVRCGIALPQDLLLTAIQKMEQSGVNCLAVIDPSTGKLQGIVRRRAILDFYERAIGQESTR